MAGLTKEERLKREAEKEAKLREEAEAKAEAKFKEENDALKRQMLQMQEMLEKLMKQQSSTIVETKETVSTPALEEDEEISLTKRVKVTSIADGGINLKTSYDSGARHFRLDQLGQTKAIQYEYLIDCINTDRWLFEEGYVYINDPKVVEDQLLEEYYQNFLTPDKIQNILTFDVETIKQMVSGTTTAIQETICNLIADKINKGQNVDMNKVYAIGNACTPKVDIMSLVNK